jgi:hypothetical protein
MDDIARVLLNFAIYAPLFMIPILFFASRGNKKRRLLFSIIYSVLFSILNFIAYLIIMMNILPMEEF